jgi:hypothetical protein
MKNYYLLFIILIFGATMNAQDYKYGKVSKKEVEAKVHPINADANAAVLFREEVIYYNYDTNSGFVLYTDVHERIKIYNKDGFDWATKEISLYTSGSDDEEVYGIRGETYLIENGKLVSQKLRRDGIFEEETNKYSNKTKLVMPSITEGCVIEYKYTKESPFLSTIDKIQLQYTIPIDKLEVTVKVPEYFVFKKHTNPKSQLTFKIEESGKRVSLNNSEIVRGSQSINYGATKTSFKQSKLEYEENIFTIEKENIPALKNEEYVDYLKNYSASLNLELLYTKFPRSSIENFSENWDDVVNKIYKNNDFGKEIKDSKYYEKDLELLLSGISLPEQKMNAIFGFVKSKVKWNDYFGFVTDNGVKDAYQEGSGNIADINLMLISMLKYAGLDATPVLLSTKKNGIPIYPTRSGFNYVVASVKMNNKNILLDASGKYNIPGMLPDFARNWMGRLIKEDGTSEWVDLMSKMTSEYNTVLKIEIEDNLDIKGKVTNIFDGYYAKNFRDKFISLSEEDHIRQLEEEKGDIVISNLETKNANTLDKPIKEFYSFKLSNGIEKIGDNIYIKPLFFLTKESNPFKSDERIYPIFFNYPSVVSNTVYVKIPEAYEIESLPENEMITINSDGAVFKLIVLASGDYLKIDSELQINTVLYLPEEYDVLKDFYNKMVQKNLETIILKKA